MFYLKYFVVEFGLYFDIIIHNKTLDKGGNVPLQSQ